MPFKSKAQRRKFAQLLIEGKISNETFEEWNRLSPATFGLSPLSRWRTASDPFREFLGSRFTVIYKQDVRLIGHDFLSRPNLRPLSAI